MHFLIRVVLLFCFVGSVAQAALPSDLEKEIKRYIQKSPSVNGLRVEPELLDPNITLTPCLGGSPKQSAVRGVCWEVTTPWSEKAAVATTGCVRNPLWKTKGRRVN